MATPAIAALAERWPAARVDVAVGRWTRPALVGHPSIARLLDSDPLLGGRRPSLVPYLDLVRRVARGRYDGALVLDRSLWAAVLPFLAGVPLRAGINSGGRGLTHHLALEIEPSVARHEASLYLACAALLGAASEPRAMSFYPSADDRSRAIAELANAGLNGQFALLHPGGGTNPGMRLHSKRWSPERFAAVGTRLRERGITPAVVWSDADDEAARAVLAAGPGLVPLGSGLSLGVLGALASRAALYLGNDSGPTHLAVAVGAPTVVVFGPSDERRYGPFGRRPDGSRIGEAVAAPLLPPDAPAPPWLERSVDGVTVEAVWAAVARALERGGSR